MPHVSNSLPLVQAGSGGAVAAVTADAVVVIAPEGEQIVR